MHFTLKTFLEMEEAIKELKLSKIQDNKLITRLIKENQNLEHQLKKANNELSLAYKELEKLND